MVVLLTSVAVKGQTPIESYLEWKRQAKASYMGYKQRVRNDYDEFRRKANAEYAEFMRKAWSGVKGHPAIPLPEEPLPLRPPEVVPEKMPVSEPMPFDDVVPLHTPAPVPEIPLPDVDDAIVSTYHFEFYHSDCTVHWDKSMSFQLADFGEATLADAWDSLSQDCRYDLLLRDCLNIRQSRALGDWGYIDFVRRLTTDFFIVDGGEAVLLQLWILAQSGYKARMARTEGGRLLLLVPFDLDVYGYMYVQIDEVDYYVLGGDGEEQLYILDHAYPGERTASLRLANPPHLERYTSDRRTIVSTQYPLLSIQVSVNQNLIDFYNHYPRVDGNWDVYARASLSSGVKEQIYPRLKEKLHGYDEQQQADMLLNMIQTGFSYATDQEQFGGERSLFADESLFYPSCDCEDRSILYSILVRDLLGLDVVLVHAPGHLFTAVRFSQPAEGDYLKLDGQRYTICDPTYIGASIGQAMPECREAGLTVYPLR